MNTSKIKLDTLQASLKDKPSDARAVFQSMVRTQLSKRNSKSREDIASTFVGLLQRPELRNELPRVASSNKGFVTNCDVQKGVSLVTCCMNRNAHLTETIPTWLAHDEVDEVVIVDWSSTYPVSVTLRDAGIEDPRMRIVRVEDEGSWILSHAYNLGFRATSRSIILKVDSDVLLSSTFFEENDLAEGLLIAGNWTSAAEGQSHVNGLFAVGRDQLLAVNGFNERIVTYGWDDDDLYERLTQSGVPRQDVASQTIRHIDHEDIGRVAPSQKEFLCAWDEIEALPIFWIKLNKILATSASPWDISTPMSKFNSLTEAKAMTTVRRSQPFGVNPSLIGSRTERAEAAIQALESRLGSSVITAPLSSVDDALATLDLNDAIWSISSDNENLVSIPQPQKHINSRPKLIIDAQHGLGNRLRAIGSAAVYAEATSRELVIRWIRDEHCDCNFSSLFEFEGAVESDLNENYDNALKLDLMDKSVRHSFLSKPKIHKAQDVIVKSAYRIIGDHKTIDQERKFLRALKPAVRVQELIDSVRSPNDVSVHIRMSGGATKRQEEDVPGDWTKSEEEMIRRARDRSHYGYFFKRLDSLLMESSSLSIFLASDNAEAYETFVSKYSDNAVWLPRTDYSRSEDQLVYGLADMLLLARAPILLGSSWSSFTEVAHYFSVNQMLEISGVDF
ncbi:galactosyltransferase-related protein [Ruegeria faecimaris]|uniref:galactosyltransferase-related protein n=1 Tax=Ruegeria faecimaris TaxID=686389 RepID=UPI00248FE21F|nr:galactosyltransferase-related protein [Ruegeria faecimaris]